MVGAERSEHQAVRLADGRLMGLAEYGDPTGRPVIFCHGEVGSRLQARAFDREAAQRGIRLISPDRPGMGFSDFCPDRTISDWPADAVELADALDIATFALLGSAGGAPYALAAALGAPDRVTRAVLAGTILPPGLKAADPDAPWLARALAGSAQKAPWTANIAMAALRQASRRPGAQLLSRMQASAGEADQAAFDRPEVRTMLAHSMAETFRSGARGPAWDLRLLAADWRLDLAATGRPAPPPRRIRHDSGASRKGGRAAADWRLGLSAMRTRVTVCHGLSDTEVPIEGARALAAEMPSARVEEIAGGGHHLMFSQAAAVLDALLAP